MFYRFIKLIELGFKRYYATELVDIYDLVKLFNEDIDEISSLNDKDIIIEYYYKLINSIKYLIDNGLFLINEQQIYEDDEIYKNFITKINEKINDKLLKLNSITTLALQIIYLYAYDEDEKNLLYYYYNMGILQDKISIYDNNKGFNDLIIFSKKYDLMKMYNKNINNIEYDMKNNIFMFNINNSSKKIIIDYTNTLYIEDYHHVKIAKNIIFEKYPSLFDDNISVFRYSSKKYNYGGFFAFDFSNKKLLINADKKEDSVIPQPYIPDTKKIEEGIRELITIYGEERTHDGFSEEEERYRVEDIRDEDLLFDELNRRIDEYSTEETIETKPEKQEQNIINDIVEDTKSGGGGEGEEELFGVDEKLKKIFINNKQNFKLFIKLKTNELFYKSLDYEKLQTYMNLYENIDYSPSKSINFIDKIIQSDDKIKHIYSCIDLYNKKCYIGPEKRKNISNFIMYYVICNVKNFIDCAIHLIPHYAYIMKIYYNIFMEILQNNLKNEFEIIPKKTNIVLNSVIMLDYYMLFNELLKNYYDNRYNKINTIKDLYKKDIDSLINLLTIHLQNLNYILFKKDDETNVDKIDKIDNERMLMSKIKIIIKVIYIIADSLLELLELNNLSKDGEVGVYYNSLIKLKNILNKIYENIDKSINKMLTLSKDDFLNYLKIKNKKIVDSINIYLDSYDFNEMFNLLSLAE